MIQNDLQPSIPILREAVMTKSEVANLLMEKTGLGRNESAQALEVFLDSVREALLRGEKVALIGFGTFTVKKKEARRGRNPKTGECIDIPEKTVVVFKPGKSFRVEAESLKLPRTDKP